MCQQKHVWHFQCTVMTICGLGSFSTCFVPARIWPLFGGASLCFWSRWHGATCLKARGRIANWPGKRKAKHWAWPSCASNSSLICRIHKQRKVLTAHGGTFLPAKPWHQRVVKSTAGRVSSKVRSLCQTRWQLCACSGMMWLSLQVVAEIYHFKLQGQDIIFVCSQRDG